MMREHDTQGAVTMAKTSNLKALSLNTIITYTLDRSRPAARSGNVSVFTKSRDVFQDKCQRHCLNYRAGGFLFVPRVL